MADLKNNGSFSDSDLDAFDAAPNDEVKPSMEDQMIAEESEFDEFAAQDESEVKEGVAEKEQDVSSNSNIEIKEGNQEASINSKSKEKVSESESDEFSAISEEIDEELLMEDFDISSDKLIEKVELESIHNKKNDMKKGLSSQELSTQDNDALDKLSIQVSKLQGDNESLRRQVNSLSVSESQNDTFSGDIEKLQKEQTSVRNTMSSMIDDEGKAPMLTHVALGVGILSLLGGAGLWALGSGVQSDITELSGLVTVLEEEIDPTTVKPSNIKMGEMDEKIKSLMTQNESLKKQMGEVNAALIEKKPRSEELQEEDGKTQQVLEELQEKVNKLEKEKIVAIKSKKIKKTAKTAKVVQGNWAVNLVSFRQKWYAKNKAAEFKKKGIAAEVIQVRINKENWFRLRVSGFKGKYDALAFAADVKKKLNLESVWVTKK